MVENEVADCETNATVLFHVSHHHKMITEIHTAPVTITVLVAAMLRALELQGLTVGISLS